MSIDLTILKTENDVLNYLAKNSGKLTVAHVLIHPEAAQAFIDIDNLKRPVRLVRVRKLAQAMAMERWKLINNGIAIDANGDFIDGQHRMLAVVLSKVPSEFYLHTGLEPATRTVIDTGTPRKFADTLVISGYAGHGSMTTEGAAIRLLYAYVYEPESLRENKTGGSVAVPHDIMIEFTNTLNANNLHLADTYAAGIYRVNQAFNKSALMAVLYLALEVDSYTAQSFAVRLQAGENLMAGDPELTVRNGVYKLKGLRNPQHFLVYLKAWNRRINNKQMKVLSVRDSEAIPTVK
jgi:hypothetical protein